MPTTYVAETARCYGIGATETQAVLQMAKFWHGSRPTEPVTLMVAEADGYRGGKVWDVDADEVLSQEYFEVPADAFGHLLDYVEQSKDDLVVDEVLGAAEKSPRSH